MVWSPIDTAGGAEGGRAPRAAGVGGVNVGRVHGAGEDGRLQVQAPVHDVVRRARVGQLGVIHDRALDGHVVVDRIDVGAVIGAFADAALGNAANLARLGAEVRGASAATRRTRRPAVALRRQTRVLVLVQAEHLVVRRAPALAGPRARPSARARARAARPGDVAGRRGTGPRRDLLGRGLPRARKGEERGSDVTRAVGRRSGDASRVSRRLATRRERLARRLPTLDVIQIPRSASERHLERNDRV